MLDLCDLQRPPSLPAKAVQWALLAAVSLRPSLTSRALAVIADFQLSQVGCRFRSGAKMTAADPRQAELPPLLGHLLKSRVLPAPDDRSH